MIVGVDPRNSRMMNVTIGHAVPITIIAAYMPTAEYDITTKGRYYD